MSRLERERRLRRMSLTGLARQVGCEPSLLGRVERGTTWAYPALRRRLASALDVDEAALFEDLDAAFAAAQAVLGRAAR